MTPTNAPFTYTNAILYRSFMFRRHLRHPQGALHQLTKTQQIAKVIHILLQYSCS